MSLSRLFEMHGFEFVSARGNGDISLLRRHGEGPQLVFLHGFGGIKEDYADTALFHEGLDAREVLAWDAPCFGKSTFDNPESVDIDLLVELAEQLLNGPGKSKFHLVGHSMGGLAALLFADRHPERILSLTSIEGNLAPQDCMFSRRILDFPGSDEEEFLGWFQNQIAAAPSRGYASYAARLPSVVDRRAVAPMLLSIVRHSDDGRLLDRFAKLKLPRLFIYGEENEQLPYLGELRSNGVALLEVARSGHFPMTSNPQALWCGLTRFLKEVEQ
jgi:pimeloyl-ACP methyl ester carboxylesterase